MMLKFIKSKYLTPFLLSYLIIIIIALVILLCFDKASIHLWFNQFHCGFCDWFFKMVTFGGDGIFVTIVAVFLLLKKIRYSMFIGLGGIFTLVLINFLKRIVFSDYLRPSAYFQRMEPEVIIRLVPEYNVHSLYSFPSGHTAAGFMLFLSLAIIFKKSWVSFLFLMAALLVGYSRIYLSQHFFVDVYFGSLAGILCCLMAYTILFHKKLSASWLDRSLLTITRKTHKA